MADKQSHKDTIVIWHEAVQLLDRGERQKALENLQAIREPSAKILYNIGNIQQVLANNRNAVQTFMKCVEKDPHMGIGHFQLAHTYYQQQNYDEAFKSLEKARTCLRGNNFIDYKQLGLAYKLYECEILHNLALTFAALNDPQGALELMKEAVKYKSESRHNIIDSALQALQQGRQPESFVVPGEHIFRPPAAKVQNIKVVDYLGKAKVVSELVPPDAESKTRRRSPSPLPPNRPPPVAPPANAFIPIDTPSLRSQSPNYKSPPFRPPPRGPPPSEPPPSGNRSSPSIPLRPPPTPPKGTSPSPSPTFPKATHKDTIHMWNEGVLMFEKGQVGPALDQMFRIVEPTAKILFNIGMLQLKLGNVSEADEVFHSVIMKDPHLAIGHYQNGNVQCQLNRPDQARRQYEKCMDSFRGHKYIDYKQLGLPYKLYEFEVLHNQAWAYYKLGQRDTCLQLLRSAQGTRPETRHDAIDNALKNAEAGAPFDIMKLPKGALFRPPRTKIDNLNKIDYLGQAKVVSELPTNSDRSPSPNTTVQQANTESFYLPMSPLSPPPQAVKPQQQKPRPNKSVPTLQGKALPVPPRKSLPGVPVGRLTPVSPLSIPSADLPAPIPPRSTSLGLAIDPPPSPGPPERPLPAIPIHITSDVSTLPRRTPPPPPTQNGTEKPTNGDHRRKTSPAFNANKPLPIKPRTETDSSSNTPTNTPPMSKRRASPVPPDKPLPPSPPSPNRLNSPTPEKRTPGPPDKPLPPSPNRLSPGSPRRDPPELPSSGASDIQERKKRPVSPLPPKIPVPSPPPKSKDNQDRRTRPVSPLPPNVPLPRPPVRGGGAIQTKIGSRDANWQSPGAARKISNEVQGKRRVPTIANNNTHLEGEFWKENSGERRGSSPNQQYEIFPTNPTCDSPDHTTYEVF